MNKNRKMVIVLLFAFVVCFSLAGCTLQDRIEEYSSDKEQCYLNTENVTRLVWDFISQAALSSNMAGSLF